MGFTRVIFSLLFLTFAPLACTTEPPYPRYEPTPPETVAAMLKLAKVAEGDVVYDLGSGDGRIVIAAVRDFGADRAVGVELDEKLVTRAQTNALEANVHDKASFVRQDLFDADIRQATVVTLYLLPEVNLLLRPKLLRDLKPGTRVVSHSHDMGDWAPEQTLEIENAQGEVHRIHLWTIP
jgi:SAM-dependent methyltransferase